MMAPPHLLYRRLIKLKKIETSLISTNRYIKPNYQNMNVYKIAKKSNMKMNKQELLQKCKEMGIKGVSSKKKDEILQIIDNKEKDNKEKDNKEKDTEPIINENKLKNVLQQLLFQTPKDKLRKVCKQCHELSHNVNSISCKINVDKKNILKNKIKIYMLAQDCLSEKTIEEHCDDLSIILEISTNLCKSLYNDIPTVELLDRKIDIDKYIEHNLQTSLKCYDCDNIIYNIQTKTNRIWNGNTLCDTCWCNYSDCRNLMWENIKNYKLVQCVLCNSIKKNNGERYHYDHVNMFNKGNSICSMVNDGLNIQEIFEEIDKCQVLCLSCHHKVTDIEHKLGFTRIKQLLTRQLNQYEITQDEYDKTASIYQQLYEEKMKQVYKFTISTFKKL